MGAYIHWNGRLSYQNSCLEVVIINNNLTVTDSFYRGLAEDLGVASHTGIDGDGQVESAHGARKDSIAWA